MSRHDRAVIALTLLVIAALLVIIFGYRGGG